MEAYIIKVGSSKGIIIPSKFLRLIGLDDRVNIEIENDKIIIKSILKKPRENWNKMFVNVNSKKDKDILIPDILEDESFDEWTW